MRLRSERVIEYSQQPIEDGPLPSRQGLRIRRINNSVNQLHIIHNTVPLRLRGEKKSEEGKHLVPRQPIEDGLSVLEKSYNKTFFS